MDYITRRAQVAVELAIAKYAGCSRAQMERRFIMANPYSRGGSQRQKDIYAQECRREIARLYPNGEGGATLFSLAEEKL